ncbi:MAG: cation transporting ATPase C-terminal domain-containing protein, partial [Bauldia litoralis]
FAPGDGIGVAGVVVGQFLFTYAPFMQAIFGTRSIAMVDGLVVIGIGILLLVLLEIEKLLRRWFMRRLA